jgi:hypothetical protein
MTLDQAAEMPPLRWNFGAGPELLLARTSVLHDFSAQLDPERPRQSFEISVDFRRPDGPQAEALPPRTGTVRRTVHVVNPYALARERGIIQPRVRSELNARRLGRLLGATLTIENVEAVPLHLTSRRIQLLRDDEGQEFLPATPVSIEIPARSSRSLSVMIPSAQIPRPATGFAVHFSGSALGKAVRASAHFDLPSRRRQRPVAVAPETVQLLDQLVRDKLVADPRRIDIHELEELAARDLLDMPAQGSPLWRMRRVRPRFRPGSIAVTRAGGVAEGNECDPDQLPDSVPDGFVCQATPETRWQPMPGRFLNARRGDIVLSPTGDTLIGHLLRSVDPPQLYSHSGIMTRNYDQITHSTASEERLLDYPVGAIFGSPAPSDGHRPDVLKYLWPGAITQTVEHAIGGEEFTDPESGKQYEIAGFDPDKTRLDMGVTEQVIFPLIVKPDPTTETPAIRQRLHAVANWALSQTGKCHYRFYCYTNPAIGLDTPAPLSASSWATGTLPTVCSSLIWLAVHQSGALLEGAALEPGDTARGAELPPNAQDGLYRYRADERLAAGELLYAMLAQLVHDMLAEEGILAEIGGWFADMADDVANQVLNSFASDWSDTEAKDSDAWRSTSDSSAVSPDNLLFWDSPALRGLYGYAEPLVYRPPRYEQVTIHRWRKVMAHGTLTGTVLFNGQPVAQALVQLYDGKFAHSDGAGRFTLSEVPEGSYVLKASKTEADGMFLSAELPVTIAGGNTLDVTITLALPDDMYRQAEVDITMYVKDWEFAAAAHPQITKEFFKVLRVGLFDTHEETMVQAVADDARGRAIIRADWKTDKSITITLIGKYYEGSWDADDLEFESNPKVFNVPAGGRKGWRLRIEDSDVVDIEISVLNAQQPA